MSEGKTTHGARPDRELHIILKPIDFKTDERFEPLRDRNGNLDGFDGPPILGWWGAGGKLCFAYDKALSAEVVLEDVGKALSGNWGATWFEVADS